MPVFNAVNDKFFNPFCCKNKEVYFTCINELLEKSKVVPVLYETDAKSTLILYLQNLYNENAQVEYLSAFLPRQEFYAKI